MERGNDNGDKKAGRHNAAIASVEELFGSRFPSRHCHIFALDFFYSTYPDDPVKRIILSGGGANIKEFRELLAVETSSSVETINPFKNLSMDHSRFDSQYLEQIAPQAAICVGLAMRRVDDK